MNNDFSFDYYRMTGEKYRKGIKSKIKVCFSHHIRYVKLWRNANGKMTLFRKLRLHKYA